MYNFKNIKKRKISKVFINLYFFEKCTFSQIFGSLRLKTKKAPMFESKKKHKILTPFSLGNKMTKKNFWASKIFSECADLLKDHFPKISNPYLYSNFWGVKKTYKIAIFTGFEITRFKYEKLKIFSE